MTEITQGGPNDERSSKLVQDEHDYTRYAEVMLEDGEVLLYDIEETIDR